jgi:hypothetical protein
MCSPKVVGFKIGMDFLGILAFKVKLQMGNFEYSSLWLNS